MNPLGDNHCLFYALQATYTFNLRNMERWRFYRYMHSQRGEAGTTMDLMRAVGAPRGLDGYDAAEWVPSVVDYWNGLPRHSEERIKVFIFGTTGHYKPLFKYGPNDYRTSIIICYDQDNKHFNGIQRAGNLFGQPYCLECEQVYQSATTHRKDCQCRCINCSRMGPGFPCLPAHEFYHHCERCGKHFENEDCYRFHLSSFFCSKSRRCDKCGEIWDVALNTRNGRAGHVCQEKWCHTCRSYHAKRPCFIQPLTPRVQTKYRIIAFDFETTQHEPYVPNPRQNFVAAQDAATAKEHKVFYIYKKIFYNKLLYYY